MLVIDVRNVHDALPEALRQLETRGIARESRNGPVIMFPEPVTTKYRQPRERVIFWPERDANPFFHFFESLWMLAGRDDVGYVKHYAKNMSNFSDDGKTFHGAYGHRWRKRFGKDQLRIIIEALRANKDDRRCALQMWDADLDLGRKGKDVPCNVSAHFQVNQYGWLDMTVFNRSNDMVWGAYGANAVHFSFLLEFMASAIGINVGSYWQVSNNLHAYLNTLEPVKGLADKAADGFRRQGNPYNFLSPYDELIENNFGEPKWEQWLEDLELFFEHGPIYGFRQPFFTQVVTPMHHAFEHFKQNVGEERYTGAIEILSQCKASDWRTAGIEWLERRLKKFYLTADSGVDHEQG